MRRAADTYKMLSAIVIFVVFLSVTLSMAAQSFPTLAPGGVPPQNSLPTPTKPLLPTASNCTTIFGTDWGCALTNFIANVINGAFAAGQMAASIFGMFFALITFQIPALQSDPTLQLLNVIIDIAIFIPLTLLGFRLAKSLIPTVGGDVD